MYLLVYKYICKYVYIYSVHIYIDTYVYTYIHIYIYNICISYIHIDIHMYTCIYLYTHAIYTCKYMCIQIHTQIHVHIYPLLVLHSLSITSPESWTKNKSAHLFGLNSLFVTFPGGEAKPLASAVEDLDETLIQPEWLHKICQSRFGCAVG